MSVRQRIDDEEIRQWILGDEGLYLWAREGCKSDDEMYKRLPAFIKKNRAELRRRIRKVLGE